MFFEDSRTVQEERTSLIILDDQEISVMILHLKNRMFLSSMTGNLKTKWPIPLVRIHFLSDITHLE